MTLDQDIVADVVYLAISGGVIGGAVVFFLFAVLEGLAGVVVRSIERHSDRAGLVRVYERLPGEGAQQHGKVGD